MILVNGYAVKQENFPDNALKAKIDCHSIEDIKRKFISNEIFVEWLYENDSELFTLICVMDFLRSTPSIKNAYILQMPYIPHARMDRVKNEMDIFTLKSFCNVINSLNFDTVIVFDPHSDVSTALLNNVKLMNYNSFLTASLRILGYHPEYQHDFENNKSYILFFPDSGAEKRYHVDGIPNVFGVKHRNWETGKIKSLEISNPEMVKGKNVIFIDDICSRGGTFVRSAKVLLEAGANRVDMIVSHCEPTILDGEVFDYAGHVVTTNSLLSDKIVDEKFAGKNITPVHYWNWNYSLIPTGKPMGFRLRQIER